MNKLLSLFLFAGCYFCSNGFCGEHFVANYINCEYDLLSDPASIVVGFVTACAHTEAGINSISEETFDDGDITVCVIMDGAYAFAHIFSKKHHCLVDFISYKEGCSSKKFQLFMAELLDPEALRTVTMKRDHNISMRG